MRKILFFILFFSIANAAEITGFWQTMNKTTHKPSSVIAIYEYEGKYYGRIVATYNKEGVMDDTMYKPLDRAPGIKGNPYYSGLDIVINVTAQGDKYKGKVIDPKGGNVYRAELWREGKNLILYGKLFVFGRKEVWRPFPESDFNESFKKPDLSKFTPSIPQVN